MCRIARLFRTHRIAIVVMVLLIPSAAHADKITYNFSGTTSSERTNGVDEGLADIPGGLPFSGSFTYDRQLPLIGTIGDPDDAPSSASYGSHPWGPPILGDDPNATINVDGMPSFATGSPTWGMVTVTNDGLDGPFGPTPSDAFFLSVGDQNGRWIGLSFIDSTGQALASNALPSVLDLGKFSLVTVEYQSEVGLMAGHITSLEAAPIPEPTTLAILAAGGLGLAVARRKARRRRPIG